MLCLKINLSWLLHFIHGESCLSYPHLSIWPLVKVINLNAEREITTKPIFRLRRVVLEQGRDGAVELSMLSHQSGRSQIFKRWDLSKRGFRLLLLLPFVSVLQASMLKKLRPKPDILVLEQ